MALERVSGGDRIRELKEKRKRYARIRFAIIVFVLCVIVGGLIAVTRLSQLQIKTIIVRGNYVVDADTVVSRATAILEETYAWVIPKRNVLLYPETYIRDQIQAEFPRFNTVSLHRENWSTLVIDVTERKNVYLWCDMLPSASSSVEQNCYYVDDYGYVVSQSPSFSGNVYFVFYGKYTWADNESPIGKKLFTDDYFKQLIRFKEGIATQGLQAHGFITYPTGVLGFMLSPELSDIKQKIVFTTTQDLDVLYENLLLALTSKDLPVKLKDEFSDLQYIDLRYDKKVYYKFGSTPDVTAQETASVELQPAQ